MWNEKRTLAERIGVDSRSWVKQILGEGTGLEGLSARDLAVSFDIQFVPYSYQRGWAAEN